MSENEESKENQERQFDEEQYQMLLRCSEKKDLTEWNEWRSKNPFIDIKLANVNLRKAYLKGGNLTEANLNGAMLNAADLSEAKMNDAKLDGAKLFNTNFTKAEMFNVTFNKATLHSSIFNGAHIEESSFENSNFLSSKLIGSRLIECNLKGANFIRADLSNSYFAECDIENSKLGRANLNGTEFYKLNIKGADFEGASVNGQTLIWNCKFDSNTNFTGVGLDSARIEPRIKTSLQGNIRRKQWEKWYEEGPKWQRFLINPFVKLFWLASDYGRSTGRIIGCFFGLSVIFALLYYICGPIDGQGIVANLFVDYNAQTGNPISINPKIVPIRAIYFSIVTMTTLGFGDMYAQPGSYLGHILLMIQVLLGYVLLGALVTRFAILFTSSGPEKG